MKSLKTLGKEAGDELLIYYIRLSILRDYLLIGNSKLHSIEDMDESVTKYSFRDPVAFDINLNEGKGGIVEGNGRIEYLCYLFDSGRGQPRGIKVDDHGEWEVPCLFGVNSTSEAEAISFSIAHNLSPFWGAKELSLKEQLKIFDLEPLKIQINQLSAASIDLLPVGIGTEDLKLLKVADSNPLPEPGDQQTTNVPKIYGVVIYCEDEPDQVELLNEMIDQGRKCKAL